MTEFSAQPLPSQRTSPAEVEIIPAPRPVHVAWVLSRGTMDRIDRVLQPLAIGLMDELVEITVLMPNTEESAELPSPPLEIIRYGRLGVLSMFSRPIEALAAQIAGEDIQLIHAMDAQGAGLARRLGALTDTRFAVSSFNLADARSLGTLEARCAAVLAGSDAIRREILEQRVSPASKVHLVRPGVHQERHATCFEQADNTASIVAGCGLDDLPAFAAVLRALADLRGRGYECLLFVIGEGKAERELRMLCDELGLRQDLTFVEHQCGKNLVDIFKAADIYVAPSPYAGVDMGALLAMAGGVPVLAGVCDPGSPASVRPGKGGSCDFVIDGRTAGIFRSADAHDLADKLAHLLDDHAAARALAESALGYLRENHSAAKMVAAVAQIYRQVTQPAEMLAAGM